MIQGKYDNPKDPGEVSHFQALTAALSVTVGLGNIAGVAVAISIGGPGATLWMIIAGLLGMTSIQHYGAWFGLGLAVLVGVVVIGGIKSIDRTGDALSMIWYGAFAPGALKGGIIGVLIVGFQRAAFSNEAGVGSAAIAHSAVKTDKPITEGLVSLLEPFVDTVVICTMTALVLIFTGTYENPLGEVAKYVYFTIFLGFMGVPNILGLLILAPEVKRDLNEYMKKLKAGEFRKYTRAERKAMKKV